MCFYSSKDFNKIFGALLSLTMFFGLISCAKNSEDAGSARSIATQVEGEQGNSQPSNISANTQQTNDLSNEIIEELKIRGACLGALQLSASILKNGGGEELDVKFFRREATYQSILVNRLIGNLSEESFSKGLKIVNDSIIPFVNGVYKTEPNTPERSAAIDLVNNTAGSDQCKVYKNPDQQAYIQGYIKNFSEEELEELDQKNNKASN